jgi:O-antigen/teichoic acid export membrane protein
MATKNDPAAQDAMTTHADLSGRDRIIWNVLAGWAGYSVYIAAGFILPRLIDDRLGQNRLGVWDFAWTFVGYFGMVQAGVISSINRYVARFRAAGDLDGINRSVSSVTCVLLVMASVIVTLAVGTALMIPVLWTARLGDFVRDAQWTVLLLGLGTASEVGLAGYAGVVTGCHRWDLHNGVHGLTCILHTSGMVAVVLLGYGLPALAAAHMLGELVGRLLRIGLAYRLCPGLRVRPHLATWSTAREMLHFGSKSFIPSIGDLLLNQTIGLLILSGVGTAALAVFTRPRSLLRHVDALVSKLAFVLSPTASSLQATRQLDSLRDLFIRSACYGVYLALPMILALAILGGPFLRLWMGPEYAQALLVVILCLGSLASITQQPVVSVLFGLNAHGRAGLANFAASLCAAGLAYLAVGVLHWGLIGAALAVSIPLVASSAIYVPALACRRLELPFSRYLRQVWGTPLMACLPFAACLVAGRILFANQPLLAIAAGPALGSPLLALVYYRQVLPPSLKAKIAARLSGRWFKRVETVA